MDTNRMELSMDELAMVNGGRDLSEKDHGSREMCRMRGSDRSHRRRRHRKRGARDRYRGRRCCRSNGRWCCRRHRCSHQVVLPGRLSRRMRFRLSIMRKAPVPARLRLSPSPRADGNSPRAVPGSPGKPTPCWDQTACPCFHT